MTGFASGTWILHGKEYRVDTLYHAYIGPGTTQTSIKLAGPVNLACVLYNDRFEK